MSCAPGQGRGSGSTYLAQFDEESATRLIQVRLDGVHHRHVEVLIRFERERPPVGEVVVVDESYEPTTTTAFVGWLGLIRALEELVKEATTTPEG